MFFELVERTEPTRGARFPQEYLIYSVLTIQRISICSFLVNTSTYQRSQGYPQLFSANNHNPSRPITYTTLCSLTGTGRREHGEPLDAHGAAGARRVRRGGGASRGACVACVVVWNVIVS